MNLIPVKTPKLIKGIFPKYVWNMPTDEKVIYLTFDDGPTPKITNWTIDLLKSYNAKATFFCIGNNIEKHPDIFCDILREGHAVGNHTYHHPNGWTTCTKHYIHEVIKTEHLMQAVLNDQNDNFAKRTSLIAPNSKLFRPPYGKIAPSQGQQLLQMGYKIIMWDILAFDWKESLSKERCANNVISEAGPGSIVVFHDSVKASKRMAYALTQTLEHFSAQGYQFKCLP